MFRQNGPKAGGTDTMVRHGDLPVGKLPVGSELLIAATFGLAGWWIIAHAVMWIAG